VAQTGHSNELIYRFLNILDIESAAFPMGLIINPITKIMPIRAKQIRNALNEKTAIFQKVEFKNTESKYAIIVMIKLSLHIASRMSASASPITRRIIEKLFLFA
jgi:hypothetical protein